MMRDCDCVSCLGRDGELRPLLAASSVTTAGYAGSLTLDDQTSVIGDGEKADRPYQSILSFRKFRSKRCAVCVDHPKLIDRPITAAYARHTHPIARQLPSSASFIRHHVPGTIVSARGVTWITHTDHQCVRAYSMAALPLRSIGSSRSRVSGQLHTWNPPTLLELPPFTICHRHIRTCAPMLLLLLPLTCLLLFKIQTHAQHTAVPKAKEQRAGQACGTGSSPA